MKTLKSFNGITLDTAALYPPTDVGASERLIGQADAAAQGFTMNTKIFAPGFDAGHTLTSAAVEISVNTSYERLNLQGHKLHGLYCHFPDPVTPLKEQTATLDAQFRKGHLEKVRSHHHN